MPPISLLRAYRIVKRRHAASAFSGDGAMQYPGRWNVLGSPVVYASAHVSLAILEMLVHADRASLIPGYVFFEVQFDERLVHAVAPKSLPTNWRDSPAPDSLARLGDDWLRSDRSAVLRVPSAVVPMEHNYVLNPGHPAFSSIRISVPFDLDVDGRLLR